MTGSDLVIETDELRQERLEVELPPYRRLLILGPPARVLTDRHGRLLVFPPELNNSLHVNQRRSDGDALRLADFTVGVDVIKSFVHGRRVAPWPPNHSLEPTLLAGENWMVPCLPGSARMGPGEPEPFAADDFSGACPGFSAGTYRAFLPKHARGNPGGFSELFIRVTRGH